MANGRGGVQWWWGEAKERVGDTAIRRRGEWAKGKAYFTGKRLYRIAQGFAC